MPVETIASAALRMILSVTPLPQIYQLFQPIGGVRARVSPQTILNFRTASPRRVLGPESDHVSAAILNQAGDPAAPPIDLQPFRQIVHGELHRPPARGGDGEQERVSGPHAENLGPVDPGRLR